MKPLVLGGAGFIGSWILKELNSRNYPVNILSRKNNGLLNTDRCRIFSGDCTNAVLLEKAMEGCNTIFHAAPYYPVYSVRKYEQYNIAMNELNNIVKTAKKNNIKKFIFISAPTVLSAAKESHEISTYCFIKYHLHKKMEDEIRNGFPAVIVIPGGCFGPGDWKVITGRVILEIISRRLRIIVDGIMNVVDVRDVARSIVNASLSGRIGTNYQLGNWNCTLSQFANKVAEIADIPPIKIKVPYLICKNIAKLVELIQYNTVGGTPLFPEVGLDLVHFGSYLDSTDAIKDLNFTACPVEKTIYDSIEWYRYNDYLTVDGKINSKRIPAFRLR